MKSEPDSTIYSMWIMMSIMFAQIISIKHPEIPFIEQIIAMAFIMIVSMVIGNFLYKFVNQ